MRSKNGIIRINKHKCTHKTADSAHASAYVQVRKNLNHFYNLLALPSLRIVKLTLQRGHTV